MTRWGQSQRSGSAIEQLSADLCLKLLDGAAERWLGDMQPLGSAMEVSLLGDRDKITKLSKIHFDTLLVST